MPQRTPSNHPLRVVRGRIKVKARGTVPLLPLLQRLLHRPLISDAAIRPL
jgi:hypothetical protein